MGNLFTRLQYFHKTRRGLVIFGLVEAVLLYIFGSIAIDTANMFAYAAAIILFMGATINIANAVDYKRLPVLKAPGKKNGRAKG